MGDGLIALLALILFIASAALFAGHRLRVRAGDGRGLPAELRGAEIAFAERTFRSHRRRLEARLDRAYRTLEGLHLVELKTRAHDAVYMSDVIELSVQRIAVEDETGEQVSPEAWVVVENSRSGTRRPHQVRLVGVEEITALRERYSEVVGGSVERPRPSRSLSQCEQCAHRERCSATFRDRG